MNNCVELSNFLLSNFYKLIPVCLDGSNYVNWKFMLETMLKGCGLMTYIDGSFPFPSQFVISGDNEITSAVTTDYISWKQNDYAVMSLLSATLSSEVLSFVVGSNSSRELWSLLKERYASTSWCNKHQMKTSFYKLRKGSDSVDKYLDQVKISCDQLATVGIHMSDEDITDSVLLSLPSEFATIKTIIRVKPNPMSIQELRSLLLITEFELEEANKSKFAPASFSVSPSTATVAQNNHVSSSHDMQYEITNASTPSNGIVPSPYVGKSSALSSSSHIAAPNIGLIPGAASNAMIPNMHSFIHTISHVVPTRNAHQYPQYPSQSFNGLCTLLSRVVTENGDRRNTTSSLSQGFNSMQCGDEQLVMKIPHNMVSLIIGKGGATIRNMQIRSGSCIHIVPLHLSPNDKSTERFVYINGGKEQIEAAKELINEVISRKCLSNVYGSNSYSQQPSYPNEKIAKVGYHSNSQNVYSSDGSCQICSQFGHIAQACSQRPHPRQVLAVGFSLQCQICLKIGHSAVECLHRHHYDFQSPNQEEPHPMTVCSKSQSPTSTPTDSESVSSSSSASNKISDDNVSGSATSIPYEISEWQRKLLKELATLSIQGVKQYMSTPSNTTDYCRQASHSMKLCKSLPLIPPG